MNIVLEQTKEFVGGKLRRNYGDAFVRGNNGSFTVLPHIDVWLQLTVTVMYISADS